MNVTHLDSSQQKAFTPDEDKDSLAIAMAQIRLVITSSEAVILYGLHKSTPSTAARRGTIPAVRSGAEWLFRRKDAERLWGQRKRKNPLTRP